MLPGYLHFDVRNGCTADMMISALSNLLGPSAETLELPTLDDPKLKPNIRALVTKISEYINEPLLIPKLVLLVTLIDKLDPKYISATKINIYLGHNRQPQDIKQELILRNLLCMIPSCEVDYPVPIDVVAVAFLKVLVGHFGIRGDSVILQTAQAWSDNGEHVLEALWCEASLPDTISELGPSNAVKIKFSYYVQGLVSASLEISSIISMLSLHGARTISSYLVQGERAQNFYTVTFVVHEDYKREVLEAFLVKGSALGVIVVPCEHHQLNKRTVSLPLGTGNKTSSANFTEYIYLNKIVRVEPCKEDLEKYLEKNNYHIDVARSDLLKLWKKWREYIIEES